MAKLVPQKRRSLDGKDIKITGYIIYVSKADVMKAFGTDDINISVKAVGKALVVEEDDYRK